jgi:hypothetical protein
VSAGLFQILLLCVIFPSASLAFNFFGLDNRSGMERLKLMPLSGGTILLGKNLAFLTIVGLQVIPLILLGTWRLGLLIGVIGIIETASMVAMYLAWGNWMSVNHPFKMQFFKFSSTNGLIVESITGILFGSLPGMIGVYFMHAEGLKAAWKIALILFASGLVYSFSVWYLSNSFAQKQDKILSAVS